MKIKIFLNLMIVGIFLVITTPLIALSTQEDRSIQEDSSVTREVVAVVNDEEIYLDEVNRAVAEWHQSLEGELPTEDISFSSVLDRLINARLLIQEAVDVGLYERPDFTEKVRRYQDQTLIGLLKRPQLSGLKPDNEEIERIYRNETRHWKFRALAFEDPEHAREFRRKLDKESHFETLAELFIKDGKAAWEGGEEEIREADVASEISSAFVGKEVGGITRIIRMAERYFVFKLTAVSYPESPSARAKASRSALVSKRKDILEKFLDQLVDKYVTVDRKILTTVGRDEFSDIKNDKRVVAKISGEDPVLAADLLSYLEDKSYHGGNASEHMETILADPEAVLKKAVEKRLYLKEAREEGIDRSDRYLGMVADFENSLLFGMYMEEFLVPQARVSEEKVRTAYEKRTGEFLLPQKIEMDVLTFSDEGSAEKALASLKGGADVNWLGKNAGGLAQKGVTREQIVPDTLPPELKSNFTGVTQGDIGLYQTGNDTYKVFLIKDLPPREKEPFELVRPRIARELFNKNMEQVFEDLTAELRELSKIIIYEDKLDREPVPQDRLSK